MATEHRLYSLTEQVLFFLSDTAFKEITTEAHVLDDNTSYDLIWLWRDNIFPDSGRVIGVAPLTPTNTYQFHIYIADVFETIEQSQWTEILAPAEFYMLKDDFLLYCYFQ